MGLTRYQVFISSTFRDLRLERQAVLDAVLSMNHFPAGMEMFPASGSTPWDVVQRVITDSDYYILIVGGKYGSTDEAGISYTEREYEAAVALGIPILVFLPENPDAIPSGKVEFDAVAREKLDEFRERLESQHHCKYWSNPQDLQYKVVVSLTQEINLNPAVGWVRADQAPQVATIREAIDQVVAATREADEQGKLRVAAELRAETIESKLAELRERETAAISREERAQQRLRELEQAAAALASGEIPMPKPFLLDVAKSLLVEPTAEDIQGFVAWDKTPQGIDFWFSEQDRVREKGALSDAARSAIEDWVARTEQKASIAG